MMTDTGLNTNIEETNNKPLMDEDSSSQDVPTTPCLNKMTIYENIIGSYKNKVDSVLKSSSTMLNSYGSNMLAQPIQTVIQVLIWSSHKSLQLPTDL